MALRVHFVSGVVACIWVAVRARDRRRVDWALHFHLVFGIAVCIAFVASVRPYSR